MDEYKLTRKKYQSELATPLTRQDLELLTPLRDRLLQAFTDELIPLVELEQTWESWIRQVIPNISVDWRKVKVFVLQARYGNALIRQQRNAATPDHTRLHRPVSTLTSTPEPKRQQVERNAIVIRASDEEDEEDSRTPASFRVTRKSAEMPTLRKPFIHTSFGETEDRVEFRPPTPSPDLLELTTEIGESRDMKKIVIKQCTCKFQFGTASGCECESALGRFLVPASIVRSRQATLNGALIMQATELLVQWRPFSNGKEWPNSWIPIEPLATWRSACLVEYLVHRIRFS